jgi:hypothetical protein
MTHRRESRVPRQSRRNRRDLMHKDHEKTWYSLKEAATYLEIEEHRLQRKIVGLNLETRTLPGEKGDFLSRKDVLELETMIKGPHL